MTPFGRITIIDPCSSPTPIRLTMILHPCFRLILSAFHKVLYCCNIQIPKETFATLLRRTELTYQPSLMLSSMVMLGRIAPQMNLKHIRPFLRNFVIFLPGPMKRCWVLTFPSWSRLKIIPWLNLSGRNLGKSILGRPQLLKLKLRKFSKLGLFILYP